MSLKDSFTFWKDYLGGKYSNITFGDLMSLWSHWPSDVNYDKNYDELFIKIMVNHEHITKFEKVNGILEYFRIHFENGNYIEFMVDASISSFLNNIKMYDKDEKLLFKFEKGKPKRSVFIEFLNMFNDFLGIREGWKIDTNPAVIDKFIDFFDFDKEKKDGQDSK